MPDTKTDRRVLFQIGGLNIEVSSQSLPVLPEANPEYFPFLSAADGTVGTGMRIMLDVGEIPVDPKGPTLFEAGDSWVLRKRDQGSTIAPHPSRQGCSPAWEADVDPSFRTIRILCGPEQLVDLRGVSHISSPFHYPLDQVLLMLALAGEGSVVHAAGVDLGGKGAILAGPSRAGKTTMSRLCASSGHPVLSDDRVIVRLVGKEFRIFGTPWPGEGRHAVNRSVPLAALVFLTKGDANRVETLSRGAAARRLLPVLSVPWFDRELAGRCLDFCTELTERVPAHELIFRPDTGAVHALEELLR